MRLRFKIFEKFSVVFFTLKKATAISAETLEHVQYTTRLNSKPEVSNLLNA
jgi:hypothetical protein